MDYNVLFSCYGSASWRDRKVVPPLYKNWARTTAAPPPRATRAIAGVFKAFPAEGLLEGAVPAPVVEGTPTTMVVAGMVVAVIVVAGMVVAGTVVAGMGTGSVTVGVAAEATAKKAAMTTEVAANFMFGKVLVGLVSER